MSSELSDTLLSGRALVFRPPARAAGPGQPQAAGKWDLSRSAEGAVHGTVAGPDSQSFCPYV